MTAQKHDPGFFGFNEASQTSRSTFKVRIKVQDNARKAIKARTGALPPKELFMGSYKTREEASNMAAL